GDSGHLGTDSARENEEHGYAKYSTHTNLPLGDQAFRTPNQSGNVVAGQVAVGPGRPLTSRLRVVHDPVHLHLDPADRHGLHVRVVDIEASITLPIVPSDGSGRVVPLTGQRTIV